jgi:hypothetical protein
VSREEAERYFGALLTIKSVGPISTDVTVNTENALYNVGVLMGGLDGLLAKLATLDGRANAAGLGASIAAGITRRSGRAGGGDAARWTVGPVNERGPELLEVGGTTLLMMGSSDGRVIPNHDPRTQRVLASGGGGGGGATQTVHVTHSYEVNLHMPNYLGNEREVAQIFREQIRKLERSTAGRD